MVVALSAWHLVLANLSRSPLRIALLLLALAAGFHLATVLRGIHASIHHGVSDDPYLMVFPKPDRKVHMPIEALDRMREVPGVLAASTNDVMTGLYYRERANRVSPVEVIFEDYLRMYEIEISADERACIRDTRMGALIERDLAREYGWQVGDRIPIRGGTGWTKAKNPPWPFILCGIYDSPSPRLRTNFLMHKAYAIENDLLPAAGSSFQRIRVASGFDPKDVARRIDALFADTPHPTLTTPRQEFERRWASLLQHAGSIVVSVSIAGVFAIGVLFAAAAVQECGIRRREFASMRAVGFGPGDLSLMLLLENGLVSLGAAGIGIATAFALEDFYQGLLLRMFGLLAFDAQAVVATLAIAGAAGVAATAIPCAMVYRSTAARELRAEPGG